MAHGVLPFQYEVENRQDGLTARGGLPLYLELAHVTGLVDSIRRRMCARDGGQGWSDVQVVLSLALLNLASGDCPEDLEALERDEGFAGILRRAELAHLPRPQRRELERRWRKERRRTAHRKDKRRISARVGSVGHCRVSIGGFMDHWGQMSTGIGPRQRAESETRWVLSRAIDPSPGRLEPAACLVSCGRGLAEDVLG